MSSFFPGFQIFFDLLAADAYWEDDIGEKVDGVTTTACEAAGNDWYEAACYE